MFAVFTSGGKQLKVQEGDIVAVEKLGDQKEVVFDKVLMVGDKIGAPYIEGATVKASVLETKLDDKVIIFKKKKRQNYRRKIGHRQPITVVKITEIKG
ncbi:MAG: 50S ribosomal protein L21 [Alphaproteobacteria bacterium]|nr:50S ribosomal protein L21 [Alphaproteobacteria bacterium]MBN2779665.1 50S ribosomal protein L21 [Alphaproteobacteria bacterium]